MFMQKDLVFLFLAWEMLSLQYGISLLRLRLSKKINPVTIILNIIDLMYIVWCIMGAFTPEYIFYDVIIALSFTFTYLGRSNYSIGIPNVKLGAFLSLIVLTILAIIYHG